MVAASVSPLGAAPPSLRGLRVWRRVRDLTQAELAARAGLSAKHYSDLELGKFQPHLSTARKLAQILGATLEELFPDPVPDALPGTGAGRKRGGNGRRRR